MVVSQTIHETIHAAACGQVVSSPAAANVRQSLYKKGQLMIITDGTHLVSTESEEELHRFALGMGLKREWYQNHARHPHYDLTTDKAALRAYRKGAKKVSPLTVLSTAWWASKSNA
jgi:tRNA G46 methylase TrmB